MEKMFCYQCQETAKGTGCTVRGVCGKTSDVANLQDLLLFILKGIAHYRVQLRALDAVDHSADRFILDGLFMTITNANFPKKRFVDKIKKLFQSNDSKRGSYTLAMTSIVIAIVIIFNMIVNLIPENKRQFDISSTNIYEISSKSEKIIKKVDDDVTFYVLAEKDSTDKRIKTFINKYASLSSKIHVKWIDPVLHPSALTKYGTEENNIVISCKITNRTTTVSIDDIILSSDSYFSTYSSA